MRHSKQIRTVGIHSPGDMGHAIGREQLAHGVDVICALDGRSKRTRRLADKAGIHDVGTLPRLVSEADVILSILVPSQAEQAAAEIRHSTGSEVLVHAGDLDRPETITNLVAATVEKFGRLDILVNNSGGPPHAEASTASEEL